MQRHPPSYSECWGQIAGEGHHFLDLVMDSARKSGGLLFGKSSGINERWSDQTRQFLCLWSATSITGSQEVSFRRLGFLFPENKLLSNLLP